MGFRRLPSLRLLRFPDLYVIDFDSIACATKDEVWRRNIEGGVTRLQFDDLVRTVRVDLGDDVVALFFEQQGVPLAGSELVGCLGQILIRIPLGVSSVLMLPDPDP